MIKIIKEKIKKEIIKMLYKDIIEKSIYPRVGSPECKCDKCMFFEIACNPSSLTAGCFYGWKMDEET